MRRRKNVENEEEKEEEKEKKEREKQFGRNMKVKKIRAKVHRESNNNQKYKI